MRDAKINLPLEFALLAMLALCWGSAYTFTKIAVAEIPPITLIAMRVGIAAAFLLAIVAWQGHRPPSDWRTWRMLFAQSFIGNIVPWVLVAWGQARIDSALATVLNSTSPIFVFFITLLITRHEPVNALKFFGACLGLGGVVMIVGIDALKGLGAQVAGQVAVVFAAMLYGYAAIYGNRLSHLPAPVTAAAAMGWAAVTLIPVSFVFDAPMEIRPSPRALAAVLALGLLCTGIALMIYFRLIRTLGSMGVASQAYLRTGVGVLLGVVLLGETIAPLTGLGLAASVLGVAAINASAWISWRGAKSPAGG
jgi:drug/metabolite transporter (DMT)-like permease